MRRAPTIIVRPRVDHPGGTWGLFLSDEERWLDLLFDREREARQFARNLILAAGAA